MIFLTARRAAEGGEDSTLTNGTLVSDFPGLVRDGVVLTYSVWSISSTSESTVSVSTYTLIKMLQIWYNRPIDA